jgi:hypothetical protein
VDIIFDIDDTLSNSQHRSYLLAPPHKNWQLYYSLLVDDPPIEPTVQTLKALCAEGHRIILVTGRPEEYQELTASWLSKYSIPYDALYMRTAIERYTSNAEAKNSIFCRVRKDGWNPVLVFEDNPNSVEMWKLNKILTLQVHLA